MDVVKKNDLRVQACMYQERYGYVQVNVLAHWTGLRWESKDLWSEEDFDRAAMGLAQALSFKWLTPLKNFES